MNAFGEPNMGNPSVRFDEGRERVGHWPVGLSIQPLPPTLLVWITLDYSGLLWIAKAGDGKLLIKQRQTTKFGTAAPPWVYTP